jgi:dienelactone hydrolase
MERNMTIEREAVLYEGPSGLFEGLAVADSAWTEPRPGVLVMPNVLGPKEADFQTADRLAELGFAAMVGDVFGQNNRATRADDNPARFMNALDADRALFRERLLVTLKTMKGLSAVDTDRTAAIGYCFGGKAVLDLARCGAELAGGVSFHGVLEPPPFPNVEKFRSKLLLCHGWDDPQSDRHTVIA